MKEGSRQSLEILIGPGGGERGCGKCQSIVLLAYSSDLNRILNTVLYAPQILLYGRTRFNPASILVRRTRNKICVYAERGPREDLCNVIIAYINYEEKICSRQTSQASQVAVAGVPALTPPSLEMTRRILSKPKKKPLKNARIYYHQTLSFVQQQRIELLPSFKSSLQEHGSHRRRIKKGSF